VAPAWAATAPVAAVAVAVAVAVAAAKTTGRWSGLATTPSGSSVSLRAVNTSSLVFFPRRADFWTRTRIGAFANVYLVHPVDDDSVTFALKRMSVADPELLGQVMREINVLVSSRFVCCSCFIVSAEIASAQAPKPCGPRGCGCVRAPRGHARADPDGVLPR